MVELISFILRILLAINTEVIINYLTVSMLGQLNLVTVICNELVPFVVNTALK